MARPRPRFQRAFRYTRPPAHHLFSRLLLPPRSPSLGAISSRPAPRRRDPTPHTAASRRRRRRTPSRCGRGARGECTCSPRRCCSASAGSASSSSGLRSASRWRRGSASPTGSEPHHRLSPAPQPPAPLCGMPGAAPAPPSAPLRVAPPCSALLRGRGALAEPRLGASPPPAPDATWRTRPRRGGSSPGSKWRVPGPFPKPAWLFSPPAPTFAAAATSHALVAPARPLPARRSWWLSCSGWASSRASSASTASRSFRGSGPRTKRSGPRRGRTRTRTSGGSPCRNRRGTGTTRGGRTSSRGCSGRGRSSRTSCERRIGERGGGEQQQPCCCGLRSKENASPPSTMTAPAPPIAALSRVIGCSLPFQCQVRLKCIRRCALLRRKDGSLSTLHTTKTHPFSCCRERNGHFTCTDSSSDR